MTRIIIAEDDPMIAEIYEKKFKEAGFDVEVADSGEQVLASWKKNNPEIILLDLILPKVNGFQVIENIRKTDKNVKIIVFSNLKETQDRERASQLGANGFVSKADYTPNDLVKEVMRLFNQLSQEKSNGERAEQMLNDGTISSSSYGTILMMEDEEIFRDMFGGKLIDDGYLVEFAEDGTSGIKLAMAGDYKLFIIDMIMPNITGEEIIAKLKREEKTKNTSIIILSASVDEIVQGKMEEQGIQGFYVKTQLIPSELSKRVKELIG